jgi:hypothetical protein
VNHIEGDPGVFKQGEVLLECAPLDPKADPLLVQLSKPVIDGSYGQSLSYQHGRNALPQLALGAQRILQQGKAASTHHVYESRGDHKARCFNGPPCPLVSEIIDLEYAPVLDANCTAPGFLDKGPAKIRPPFG